MGLTNGSRKCVNGCDLSSPVGLYAFFENKNSLSKNWQQIAEYELRIGELLSTTAIYRPKIAIGGSDENRNLHRRARPGAVRKGVNIHWESVIGIGDLSRKWESRRIPIARS